MDADGAVLIAFLVNGEGGLLAVLMKVLDPQAAGGGEPDPGTQVGFQDGGRGNRVLRHQMGGPSAWQARVAVRDECLPMDRMTRGR